VPRRRGTSPHRRRDRVPPRRREPRGHRRAMRESIDVGRMPVTRAVSRGSAAAGTYAETSVCACRARSLSARLCVGVTRTWSC
jgi:hypothetical protein